MSLPERTAVAEDAFVSFLADSEEIGALTQAITEALDDKRPMLAARLAGLLDDRVHIEPGSALHRAVKAARFLVFNKPTAAENSWSAFDDAWRQVRSGMVSRARLRQRNVTNDNKRRIPRVPGKSTRRH